MKTNKKTKSVSSARGGVNGLSTTTRSLNRKNQKEGNKQSSQLLPTTAAFGQGYVRLIRIPKKEDRVRAIGAFLRVPRTRCSFSDFRYLVTREHIEALLEDDIPFEDITDAT